ncbi:cation transporter [Martelella endophytica]|uniref:Cation transporter n=2 Tax=Martelella endophytica TaxID=1486262 RepID=A0A0D5LRE4_MAREN|nr:cation transporter [Martelella endophytica]
MGSSRTILLASCTALMSAAFANVALAQEAATDGATTVLAPVSVTTVDGRDNSGVADTPLSTEVTEQELDQNMVQSVDDLSRMLVPGVAMTGGDGGSINIRGLQGPRVLTTIDGVPIPFLDPGARSGSEGGSAGGGVDSFDFNSFATIDIVRGADSSRAGGGAMGGAFLINTLNPEDLIEPGKMYGGRVRALYNSADESITGDAAFAVQSKSGTSALFQGIYTNGHETETNGDVGGIGSARTEANPANYDEDNFLFKLQQQIDDATRLGLTIERYDFDKDINLMTAKGATYDPNDWNGIEDKHRDRVSLDYTYNAFSTDGWVDAAWATVYWQRNQRVSGTDGNRLTSPKGSYGRVSKITQEDYGFTGWASNTFFTGGLEHTVTIGGSFDYATFNQYNSGHDSCDVTYSYACNFYHNNQADTPEVNSYDLGLYIQDEIVFGDSGFALTPGIRLDAYSRDPQDTAGYENNPMYAAYGLPQSQDGVHVSPKILATYDLTDDIELFGQFSTSFRAPTAPELYLAYGAPGSYLSIGNPDLDPESGWGFELGSNFGDTENGARVAAFYNRYYDFIDTRNLTDAEITAIGLDPADYMFVSQNVNIANVQIAGIELSGQRTFDNDFSVRGSLAFARGWNMDDGDSFLASVAPLKAILGGGYNKETWGVNANWVLSAAVSDKTDVGGSQAYQWPGYGIVDMTAWWEPEQLNGFRVQAGVFNIFDQTYYEALDNQVSSISQPEEYYSQPGRSFRISLTQRF